MSYKIEEIEGVGEVYGQKLRDIGIATTEALLEAGRTPAGRKDLAAKSGISSDLLLKWINRADLKRVKGIGTQYSDLLEHSGVDTVPELAQRNAANLHAKMAEVNDAKSLVRQLPTLANVEDWIAQSKSLPRAIEY